MTYGEANAILAKSGLSIEGFMAFKARRRGEEPNAPVKKMTSKEWLNGKKDCFHCCRDGNCREQEFGYVYDNIRYSVNGVMSDYEENGLYNSRTPTGYQQCCIWSSGMMEALYTEVARLIRKGEIIE